MVLLDESPAGGAELESPEAILGEREQVVRERGRRCTDDGERHPKGIVVGLVLTGMKDNAIYSKPVDELVAQKAKFAGRPVRAEGNLVHGTLLKRDSPCEYRFTITKHGVDANG